MKPDIDQLELLQRHTSLALVKKAGQLTCFVCLEAPKSRFNSFYEIEVDANLSSVPIAVCQYCRIELIKCFKQDEAETKLEAENLKDLLAETNPTLEYLNKIR